MAGLTRFLAVVAAVLPLVLGQALPLHTSSRWILDSNNNRVKLRCVNWAGHMETHVPEGLHKQSVDYLAGWIAKNGFNCVRLTYSIDQALNPSLKVSDAFTQAASAAGVSVDAMNNMYSQAVAKNPWIASANTADVYGKIVDTLWSHGVMTILDNHVSKASWCCNLTDGNGWWDAASGYNSWNSRYFNTGNWLKGLQAQAMWANSHPGIVAMSLRNELRGFLLQDIGRSDWFNYVTQGANAVHAANPNVLIVIGGVASATDLSFVRTDGFDTSAWAGKHVWEWHAYSFTVTYKVNLGSCDVLVQEYGAFNGFLLQQNEDYTGPLLLSEFGVGMTGGPNQGISDDDFSYLTCLVSYLQGNDAEWAVWALQGSYYVRDGTVDYDEGFGLLDHDWNDWRNSDFRGLLGSMWNVTQLP